VLIHVAIALLGLIAFSAFVADYGVMWVSRGQAQTAADAGALSGALSLAFDSSTNFTAAKERARAVAIANMVFGGAPDVQLTDVTFPPCPPNTPGLPDTCVKVDAFRNQTRGNPLPMFFGRLVGVNDQGVRATATAQIVTGTHTDCLKPWAILDRWDEYDGAEPDYPNPDPDFNYASTFDRYSDGKGKTPPAEADLYVPPGGTNGTGQDFGCRRMKEDVLPSRSVTANTRSRPGGSGPFASRALTVRRVEMSIATTSRAAADCPVDSPRRTRFARPISAMTTRPTGRSEAATGLNRETWWDQRGRGLTP
jgi:hypothetical protein